jgi:hypothetical protein
LNPNLIDEVSDSVTYLGFALQGDETKCAIQKIEKIGQKQGSFALMVGLTMILTGHTGQMILIISTQKIVIMAKKYNPMLKMD